MSKQTGKANSTVTEEPNSK